MKELQQILARFAASPPSPSALATVVRVDGSAYRRPGARMLVGEDGILEGSVSGGCLEKDVLLKARAAMLSQRASLIRYDSSDDEDEFVGFRMGCKGIIDILIEPVGIPFMEKELPWIRHHRRERQACLLAKITHREGSSPLSLGGYLLMDETEAIALQSDPALDVTALQHAKLFWRQRTSGAHRFTDERGALEVFFEVLLPPPALLVFGTGPDVPPLLRLAREIGIEATVIDPRGTAHFPGRFQAAHAFISGPPDQLRGKVSLSPDSAAVVMTHHYPLDLELLEFLISSSIAYLGILGPRKRTDRLLADLKARGREWVPEQLEKIYAPVGLDIGADTPEAIALSILAEIQSVLSQRTGGPLRDRNGAIHEASR